MHLDFKNVREGFLSLVKLFKNVEDNGHTNIVKQDSRNGPVLRKIGPLSLTFERPDQRVLIDPVRDANPFFHMYEALWMLGGRNDVDSVAYYVKQMRAYSDDGETFHGAYGYRWRKYFGYDQIQMVIDELSANPDSRRCVLQMWDGGRTQHEIDTEGRLPRDPTHWTECEPVEGTGDLYIATHGGKDVPCNLCCVFEIVQDKLNMTVYNRSNDSIWGMLGANYVHMTVLQEYVAMLIGVELGIYSIVTSNGHIYLNDQWTVLRERVDTSVHSLVDCRVYHKQPATMLWAGKPELVDSEISFFLENEPVATSKEVHHEEEFTIPFIHDAWLACKAYRLRKEGKQDQAIQTISQMVGTDWKTACIDWVGRRIELGNVVQ